MKRNDYVLYHDSEFDRSVVCRVEQVYGDGHVLLYAVDSNVAYLAQMYELIAY